LQHPWEGIEAMKGLRDLIIVGVVLVLLVVWQVGIGRERIGPGTVSAEATATGEGEEHEVRLLVVPIWHTAVGTVESRIQTAVAARVMAAVTEVAVDVGDPLEPGTFLVGLDDRDLQARADAARAALSGAEARLKLATQARDRVARLVESNAATPAQLEAAQADFDAAQARVRAASEGVTEAEVALDDTRIVSPMKGVVVERLVDPGDLASPGRPLLQLHAPEDLRLEANVPQRLAMRLRVGDAVRVRIPSVPGDIETTIEEIVPLVDPRTRTAVVKADLPVREGIRPGVAGELRFPLDEQTVTAVPREAVRPDGTVLLLREDGSLRVQTVRTGRLCEDGVRVEILSGLAEGDTILIPRSVAGGTAGEVGPSAGAGVAVVERREEVFREAVGTLRSRTETRIAPRVMARIREVKLREGESVAANAVVALLDDRDLQARLDRGRAGLAEAEARLVQARQALARVKGLVEKGVATSEQLEAAQAAERSAEAMRAAAEEGVQEATVALGYAEIRTPVAGVVVRREAEPGDLAIPGRPIVVLHDPASLRFEAAVPEALAGRLEKGGAVEVRLADVTIPATVDEIVPAADPRTRTVTVKAPIPAQEGLRPGLFGRLRFLSGERRALLIPSAAVTTIGQVTLVRLPGADGPPLVRYVRTRPWPDGDLVEVLSGLSAGDRVLVEGR
jgi:RND family efflux transporter MFP subunit